MSPFTIALGSGIVDGMLIALVAVGFTLIYEGTRVANFANGQFMIAGAYASWWFATRLGWPFIACAAVGVGVGMVTGFVTDRLFISPVRNKPLLTQVMVLFGLANIMTGVFIELFGPEIHNSPAYASQRGFVPFFDWSTTDIVIMSTTVVVVGLLVAALYLTGVGRIMRASADNRIGASLVGINPKSIALATWGIGGAITALAGLLIIPKLSLDPSLGDQLTFEAFGAVALGGFGSLPGAVVGGLIIGVAEQVVAVELSAGYEPMVSLVVTVIVLSLRPAGLFGKVIA